MNGRFSTMNQIKKDLEKELRSVTLSDEKKQSMLRKMNRKNRVNWSYRFVLTACTLLGLGFSYLLFTGDLTNMNHAARPEATVEQSLLSPELSKVLIMLGVYIVFYLLMKIMLRHRTLAVCANCGEEWTYGQSLKASMFKGKEVKCPYCEEKQVKTAKSNWEMGILQWIFPVGILFSQFFASPMRGFLLYAAFAMLIVMRFNPYLLSFQGAETEVPSRKNQVLKWVKMLAPAVIIMLVIWGSWEKSEAYSEPQEAIYELYFDSALIPGYVLDRQALFFTISDDQLLGAHYVDKRIFGWKAKGFLSYPINNRDILANNHVETIGKRHLIYGLIDRVEDAIVQVNGEEARLLNLAMLPEEEIEKYNLEGLSIWYFESEKRIDTAEAEVQVVDRQTGKVLDTLSFD